MKYHVTITAEDGSEIALACETERDLQSVLRNLSFLLQREGWAGAVAALRKKLAALIG